MSIPADGVLYGFAVEHRGGAFNRLSVAAVAAIFSATSAMALGAADGRDPNAAVRGAANGSTATSMAEEDARGNRIAAAFRDWADRWVVPNAALVVMTGQNQITGRVRKRGAYNINKPTQVASLSKAITGVCIAKLVDKKKIKYNQPLKKLLKEYLNANAPVDRRVRNIQLQHLLTHTSGITYFGFAPLAFTLNWRQINAEPLANETLSQRLGHAPGKKYFYNNMNYLLLGMIIDKYSGGLGYEEYCKRQVLRRVGVTKAHLGKDQKILGAWGGWKISPIDYAKFLRYFDPTSRLIKKPVNRWPMKKRSRGARYSIGTLMRSSGGSYNFWHAGSWRWCCTPADLSYGAYYFSVGSQFRYVAMYSPAISNAALFDLDRALRDAAFQ